ncbi:hypothetical protein PTSG_01870 [Salpingoeca rosetta]|uniref:MACPF domain-containing protein n=1 Tax=Salpingoeca rosetta (strain ATCC 50818 / BSB-021) TaxID=946362 RepID=F2TZ70_SALR5|nr:uncharacterized protein PTSG_01870 [Salpingoeca rosetta]EGD78894.1 hypothetical protein PTSG_01870 [Salpingoeca rosetta]|eukprot:XP_004997850.1 hypothetical protein PTSG_01870 [Salpingoeca rosetta]
MHGLFAAVLVLALLGTEGHALSPPNNVDIVGKGVLTFQSSIDGDPQCSSSRCNTPGFMSSAVFNLSSFEQGQHYEGTVAVPDGWTYLPNFKCRLTDSVKAMHDWFDYKSVVNAYTHSEHHGLFHSSSETHWFSAVNSLTVNKNNVVVRHSIACTSYHVQRNTFDNSAVLTAGFKSNVAELLPRDESEYNDKLNDMLQFANAYGDSVVADAEFGGKSVRVTAFSQESFEHLRKTSGDLHSSATLNHICSIGDDVLCNNRTPGWNEQEAFNSSKISVQTSYIPFPPVHGQLTRGANAWALAVEKDPGVVAYTLQNLTAVLTPAFFPNDPAIGTRAQLYQRFLNNDFCKTRAGGCPKLPPRSARWTTTDTGITSFQPMAGHAAVFANVSISTANANANANAVLFFSGTASQASLPDVPAVQRYVPAAMPPKTAPTPTKAAQDPSAALQGVAPWTLLSQDPRANVANASAAVLNDRVYVTGGAGPPFTNTSGRTTVISFSPQKNEWINVEPMQTRRQLHCTFVACGALHVTGGGTPVTEVYDPETDSWSTVQPMPLTLSGMSCTVVNDSLVYVVGGVLPDGTLNAKVLLYNVDTDLWSDAHVPPMGGADTPRMGHAAVVVGNDILIMGGRDATGLAARSPDTNAVASLSDVRILQLPVKGATAEWIPGCGLPEGTAFAPAVTMPSVSAPGGVDVVVAGGCKDSQCKGVVSSVQTYTIAPGATIQCSQTAVPTTFGANSNTASGTSANSASSSSDSSSSSNNSRAPRTSAGSTSSQTSKQARVTSAGAASPPLHPGASLPGMGVSTVTGKVVPARVFEPDCKSCFWLHKTHDNQSVPNALDVRSLRRCSFQTETGLIQDEVDAQVAASAWMSAELFFGFPGLLDFAFSANFEAGLSASASTTFRHTTAFASGRCELFDINYIEARPGEEGVVVTPLASTDPNEAPRNSRSSRSSRSSRNVNADGVHTKKSDGPDSLLTPPVSPDFKAAVNLLVQQIKEGNTTNARALAVSILQHFGDAYVSSASFGARFSQSFEMTESHFHAALRANVDFGYSSSHSTLFFWGGSHSEDAQAHVSANADLVRYTSSNRTTCVPLCPPLTNNVTINTTGFDNIFDSDGGHVSPIATRVRPITEVVTPAYFPTISHALLNQTAELIRSVMLDGTYCAHTPGCSAARRQPTWQYAPNMLPVGATYSRAVLVNESAVVVAGGWLGTVSDVTLLYRPPMVKGVQAPQWQHVSPAPITNASSLVLAPNSALWSVCNVPAGSTSKTQSAIYNTTTGIWVSGPSLPDSVNNAAAALDAASGKIVAVGMLAGASTQTACRAYHLDTSASSPSWQRQPHTTPLLCLANATAVADGSGSVFLFGGRRPDGSCSSAILKYNVTTDEVRVVGYLPMAMCSGQAHTLPTSSSAHTTTTTPTMDRHKNLGRASGTPFPGRASDTVVIAATDPHSGSRLNVWRWNMVTRELVVLPSFNRGGDEFAAAITTVYMPSTDELYAFGDGMLPLRLRAAFGVVAPPGATVGDKVGLHPATQSLPAQPIETQSSQAPFGAASSSSHGLPWSSSSLSSPPASAAHKHPLHGRHHQSNAYPQQEQQQQSGRIRRGGSRPVAVSPKQPQGKPALRFQQVDMMLRGYHTIRGDPLSRTGADPGWSRYPVFEMDGNTPWSGVMQVPGDTYDWTLPPGINGEGGASSDTCKYAKKAWHVHGTTALQHTLRGLFSVIPSKKFLWPSLLGFEYSLGGTWAMVTQQTASFTADLAIAIGHCTRYTLSRPNYASGLSFTTNFLNDLRALPRDVDDDNLPVFANFTDKYGLYLPNSIQFGSMSVQVSAVESSMVRAMIEGKTSLSGGAEAALLFFFDLDASASASASANLTAEMRQAMTFNYTTCMPRCPPRVKDPSNNAAAWQAELELPQGEVYPVGVQLDALPNVLDQSRHNLPSDLQGEALTDRLVALTEYCDHYLPQHLGAQAAQANLLWKNASHVGEMPAPPGPLPIPSALRHPVMGAAALMYHNDTLVIGGFNSSGLPTTEVQVFSSGSWVTQGMLPTPTAYAAATVFRDQPYVCGGIDTFASGTPTATGKCYSAVGGEWSARPSLQVPRFGHSMVVVNGALYAIGGMMSNGTALASIEVLTTNATTWTILNTTSLPAAASGIAVAYSHALNKAVLVGGLSDGSALQSILVFDGTKVTTISPRLVLRDPVAFASVMEMQNGWLLVTNGVSGKGGASTRVSYRLDLQAMSVSATPTPPSYQIGAAMVPITNTTGLLFGGESSFTAQTIDGTYPFIDASTSAPFTASTDIKVVSFQ